VNLTGNIATVFLPFLFYYLLGLLLKNIKISLSSVTSLVIIYFYITIFVSIISGGQINSYTRNFESIPVIIMAIIAFITLNQANKIKLLHKKRIESTLQYLSSLVFGAYLAHVVLLLLFDKGIRTFIPESIGGLTLEPVILKFFIVLLGAFGIAAIIRKVPVVKFLSA
jgi:surface polysaccharide O-acyltransferase-like enzyme